MTGILLLVVALGHAAHTEVKPTVGRSGNGGNSGVAGAVNPGSASNGVISTLGTASLQASPMGTMAPTPALTVNRPGAAAPANAPAGSPSFSSPAPAPAPAPARRGVVAPAESPASAVSSPDSPASVVGAQLAGAQEAAAAQKLGASASLGGAARGVDGARAVSAPGSEGMALRSALDKAFDSMPQGAAMSGADRTSPNAVAGSVQDVRGRIEQTLAIARTAPPADAPDHYRSAVDIAEKSLPDSAAAAVAKAVRAFASAKAERALPELAAAAYAAAAGGVAGETGRLLKGFDKWEGLLGTPGRPLVSNGEMLKADVRRRLEAAAAGNAAGSTPRVWFQKRGASYVAALPGSAVARLAPLAGNFTLSPTALSGNADLSAAWRAYAADPRPSRGFAEVYKAVRSRDGIVPAAYAATKFWLRAVLSAVWRRLLALFGRGGYALATPAGVAEMRADMSHEAQNTAHAASVRAALDAGAPTVGSLRAALAALRLQAAAHERLRGAGASAAVEALAGAFAAATAGRADSDPLTGEAAELAYGPDGVYRQSQILAQDAAAYVDARVFSGVGSEGGSRVEGSRLWVQRPGPVRLSADLRSTGAGGFIILRAKADESTAARFAQLGLAARFSNGYVTASYDADAADLDAAGMKALAEDALAALSGATASVAELRDLAVAVASDAKAARAARERALALDGRVQGGRVLGRVTIGGDEYDAVSAGRTLFLRGADGLPAFAR
jgi:hypothetical protein